jgi:single-stranded DNA-binding protein
MTFTVNKCILAGRIGDYGVKLTYLPSGKPELSFSLVLEKPVGDRTYKTFIPVPVYGTKVEALAEMLEPGDLVLVDGQLAYKMEHHVGGSTTDKRPATLAVTCFAVEVLQHAKTVTESS